MTKENSASFESNLKKLEKIIHDLENSELNLDKSLVQFEQGVQLYRACKGQLETAQKKIKKLTDSLSEEEVNFSE